MPPGLLDSLFLKRCPGETEAAGPGNTLTQVWMVKRDPVSARVRPAQIPGSPPPFTTRGPRAGPPAFYLIRGHNITNFVPRPPTSRIHCSSSSGTGDWALLVWNRPPEREEVILSPSAPSPPAPDATLFLLLLLSSLSSPLVDFSEKQR